MQTSLECLLRLFPQHWLEGLFDEIIQQHFLCCENFQFQLGQNGITCQVQFGHRFLLWTWFFAIQAMALAVSETDPEDGRRRVTLPVTLQDGWLSLGPPLGPMPLVRLQPVRLSP